jgi:membrane-associated phospholipid phosphatase
MKGMACPLQSFIARMKATENDVPKQVLRMLTAGMVAAAVIVFAPAARATDPDRVEWSPDWPRIRLVEGLDIVAFTVASYEIDARWPAPRSPSWRGGIAFDDAIRSALRGRTLRVQSTASDISDALYFGGVLAPYVVDVYLGALGIHQNADVSIEMLLMDMRSLGIAGVVSLGAEHAVGRARPYVSDRGRDGSVRDAQGRPLLNGCGSSGAFQSFYSGHAAATATMAGLTCVHHQHLPLYGGGLADLAPCIVMIGASTTTGVARVIADRHWATDVITGWSVGALAGYVLLSLLHYGFGKSRPIGEVQVGAARIVPVPQAYVGGAGFGIAGSY